MFLTKIYFFKNNLGRFFVVGPDPPRPVGIAGSAGSADPYFLDPEKKRSSEMDPVTIRRKKLSGEKNPNVCPICRKTEISSIPERARYRSQDFGLRPGWSALGSAE